MARRRKVKLGICFYVMLVVFVILLIVLAALVVPTWWEAVANRDRVETKSYDFTESAREVKNPNRGFYRMYSFPITDKKTNYKKLIGEIDENDNDTKLMMTQINLKAYRDGKISKKGLANIKSLLDILETVDKQLIVRFVYDNEGKNEQYEPDSLDIILKHMVQLEDILKSHSKQIFILQSLFVGNWGEMNGTRYDSDEDFRKLAWKLADVSDEATYLCVRVPAQWRRIMQSDHPSKEAVSGNLTADRLGLFNDGMLGNESDYGTYCTDSDWDSEFERFPRLTREEEIEFQNELCRRVPNGGEVINDNVYNDFSNAVKDLAAMHITYLNKVYDPEVLDKWKQTKVKEKGCFYGMDGLTFIDRHLGYRLVMEKVHLAQNKQKKCLSVGVELKNAGFAPLYKEPKIRMVLQDEEDKETFVYPVTQSIRGLAGGNEAEKTQILDVDIPFHELTGEKYTVYFSMVDQDTGEHILLANEEDEEQYGYRIGTIKMK